MCWVEFEKAFVVRMGGEGGELLSFCRLEVLLAVLMRLGGRRRLNGTRFLFGPEFQAI
jgi:hypothetical protein